MNRELPVTAKDEREEEQQVQKQKNAQERGSASTWPWAASTLARMDVDNSGLGTGIFAGQIRSFRPVDKEPWELCQGLARRLPEPA